MFRKVLFSVALMISISLMAMQVQAAEGFEYAPDNHTLALWHLDEGQGENIIDASPNKVDGTVQGKAKWDDEEWKKGGTPGKSFVFDGTTVINFGNVKDVKILSAEAVTVEAWVYADELSTWNLIFTNWGNVGGRDGGSWHLGVNNRMPRFHIDTGVKGAPVWADALAGNIDVNEWYHIAGTYDSKEGVKIYVDGKLAAETKFAGDMWMDNDRDIILGSKFAPQSFHWKGRMDEVRISDIARSPEELSPNLTAPQAVAPAESLASTWGFIKNR